MPMSDDLASTALNVSQKGLEIAAEIIKMLAPYAKKGAEMALNAVMGERAGVVSNGELVAAAQKAGSPISTTSNFLARDAQSFAEKAKEYKIPVAVVGHGEKVTMEFLDRDKGIVEQITNELMAERLKENPQSVKCFSVGENNVSSLKAMFEENNIECQFLRSSDGKIKCVYPAENTEQVAVIKEDYNKIHKEVAKNFSVKRNEDGSLYVSDSRLEKSFPLTPLNKSQVSKALQEKLGYSSAQADIAANKLCYELGLNKEKYFTKSSQLDNLKALQSNIRYQSDDLTIRDIRYNAVYFKDGADPHILLQFGDNAIGLTPAKMSRDEMLSICKNQLGLTDNQSQLAIAKAEKIESQMRSKVEERTIDDKGLSLEMHIERTANDAFTISLGDKSQSYNFSDKNATEKLSKDFGVPLENAKNAVSKAQKQSVIQNKIRNAANKKNAPAPEKPKLSESKVKKR